VCLPNLSVYGAAAESEETDMNNKQINTPAEVVDLMAKVAHTSRQTFCIDEPPLPTFLCDITWSAEEFAIRANLPESVMDDYRRTVFTEHPNELPSLTAQELQDTREALINYISSRLPEEQTETQKRLIDGITNWDELIAAAE